MFGHQDDQVKPSDDSTVIAPVGTSDNSSDWRHPEVPFDPIVPEMPTPSTDLIIADIDAMPVTSNSTNDLIDIKQKALSELSPLVGHLDQSPEEKFRTTMMMIQASDDQSLVETAYQAALNITDEKSRAQALLDIINEINYFTQQHEK
jgi:hypothetical protein